jgi:hypothetical protein
MQHDSGRVLHARGWVDRIRLCLLALLAFQDHGVGSDDGQAMFPTKSAAAVAKSATGKNP